MNQKNFLIGRRIFFILACLYTLCIFAQIFIAGMAVFVDGTNWMRHTIFVHIFGFNLPVFMLIIAFFSSLPRWGYWHLLAIFVSTFFMYFTANITVAWPVLGALHPVLAIIMAGIACSLVIKTWGIIGGKQHETTA